jgi:hypothetical protein
MLILGHAGITLGAAVAVSGLVSTIKPPKTDNPGSNLLSRPSQWLTALANRIDIRCLLLGALLPDIIDKPLGYIFFRDSLSSSRSIAHTFFFLIVITLAGLLLYHLRHKSWLLVVSAGTLAHLVLDQIWLSPQAILWPFSGLTFEQRDMSNYLGDTFTRLTTDPATYIPEIIGGLILLWFGWEIIKRHRLVPLIKYGKL